MFMIPNSAIDDLGLPSCRAHVPTILTLSFCSLYQALIWAISQVGMPKSMLFGALSQLRLRYLLLQYCKMI